MKKINFLFTLLLVAALVGAVVLVRQNQQLNRGATFANTTLSVLPSSVQQKNVGDNLPVTIEFLTEGSAKVDGVQANVCYGPELSLDPATGATAGADAGFSSTPIVVINQNASGQSCATVAVTSQQSADNLKTTGVAFTLNFTALSGGSGAITIDQTKSMVTGDNPNSPTDKTLAITAVNGTTYQISGTANTGTGPELKFKFTFAGVAPSSACAVSWPLKVVALGNGQSLVATNVLPTDTGTSLSVNGQILEAYTASIHLGTLPTSNLALFVKGPKHLQMKYAKDAQAGPYGASGGTLCTGTGCPDTYDFTGYPILPGDVNQDGWINSTDFSLVKTDASKYVQVNSGQNTQNDLDGSCQVNTRDESLLVNSLNQKQEELY